VTIKIPLDARPRFAAALGRLVGHWGVLESNLILLFQILMGTDQFRAAMVFNTFPAVGQKIQLLERLTHSFLEDDDEKRKVLEFLKRAKSLMDVRNGYVHAIYGYSAPPELCWRSISLPSSSEKRLKKAKIITYRDIQNDCDKIAKLSGDITNFLGRLETTMRVRPLPLS
jgi:hypothetical protein